MFGSVVIDVVIGLTLVYLLLSLVSAAPSALPEAQSGSPCAPTEQNPVHER